MPLNYSYAIKQKKANQTARGMIHVSTNPVSRAECDTRSILSGVSYEDNKYIISKGNNLGRHEL